MDLTYILIIIVVILLAYYFKPRDPSLPPGPRPFPIVGNIPEIFIAGSPFKYARNMSKRYGQIYQSYFGSYPFVTIAGYKNIREAFLDKSDVFSGRAKDLPGSDLYSNGKGILSQDGEPWRKMRRFTLSVLRDFGFGKKSVEERILDEGRAIISEISKFDGKVWEGSKVLFQKATCNVISSLIFGNRFEYTDPEFLAILTKLHTAMRKGPPVTLEFIFPFLKYFRPFLPGVSKKAPFVDFVEHIRVFIKTRIEEHRKNFDSDNPRDYVDMYIKVTSDGQESIDEEDMFAAIIDLFLAGTETTATTLDWAILYMMEYPDVQKLCQQEIDKVIGQNRSINLADKVNLPYVEATTQEIHRYAAIVSLGVSHCCTEDTTFHGYKVPRGTILGGNIFSALRDPDYWENPDKFQPERFISNGKVVKKEAMIPFSIGPRVCLGETLAKQEVFLYFANLLQQFTFSLATPVDWSTETYRVAVRGAPDYDVRVTKRS